MRGHKISEEIKAEIIRRVEAGEKRTNLSKEYGISYEVVKRIAGSARDGEKELRGEDWREWFKKEWARIYPGDKVRRMQSGAETVNQPSTV